MPKRSFSLVQPSGTYSSYSRKKRTLKRSRPKPVVYSGLGETKFFDTTFANAAIDTTAENFQALTLIPQGVTESTRVGRKCTVRSLGFKGHVDWSPSGISPTNIAGSVIKIAIVLDKQANGANPAWTDVYTAATVSAPRNLANAERFQVLKEWMLKPEQITCSTTDNWVTLANTVVLASPSLLKFNRKCNIPLEFSGATGAITELRSNSITMLAVSNLGDDIHTLSGVFRVRFSDK